MRVQYDPTEEQVQGYVDLFDKSFDRKFGLDRPESDQLLPDTFYGKIRGMLQPFFDQSIPDIMADFATQRSPLAADALRSGMLAGLCSKEPTGPGCSSVAEAVKAYQRGDSARGAEALRDALKESGLKDISDQTVLDEYMDDVIAQFKAMDRIMDRAPTGRHQSVPAF